MIRLYWVRRSVLSLCFCYSGTGEVFVLDAADNETKISPHNDKGEWEYYSRNSTTGKTVRINMEAMIRDLEKFTGSKYIETV